MAPFLMTDLEGEIWFNGEFVPWADAKVHVLTHGLHYASSVFEGERAYGGEIFKLDEHTRPAVLIRRHVLGFEIPYSVDEINAAMPGSCWQRKGLADAYVRPIAWRGSEMMGVSAQNNRINVAIAIWEWPSLLQAGGEAQGHPPRHGRVAPARSRRPRRPQSKAAGLYMICTLSKHAAERKGYADAMMLDWRGQVAEATGANIFFVKDGVIHTPTPDCFLNGITRQTVIDLAKRRGFEVVERAIMPEELAGFEECFLTGTAAEVTPVSEIGAVQVHARRDLQDPDGGL